ncbi:MAG: hypothetical protein OJF50_003300 [Nitrospira sp.]|nr:hypothetical protein [Nitrospira sp.]
MSTCSLSLRAGGFDEPGRATTRHALERRDFSSTSLDVPFYGTNVTDRDCAMHQVGQSVHYQAGCGMVVAENLATECPS